MSSSLKSFFTKRLKLGKILTSMEEEYIRNSTHKDYIRDKWIEFSTDVIKVENGLSVITFPAAEMHDLRLFAERGLIEWQPTETGAYSITKGKVVCFEKSTNLFIALSNKLSNAVIEKDEFGSYLRSKYQGIMNGSKKIFPVDVVNLDYDGSISKSKVPIDEIIKLVFEYQALHKKSFCLFMTWPSTESVDSGHYKNLLKQTISNNLEDPRALAFKEIYEASLPCLDDLDYDQLSIIGLSKIIIQKASHHRYNLNKNEFYIYGEQGRHKMFSILLNFDFKEDTAEHALYSNSVIKSLLSIINLQNTT